MMTESELVAGCRAGDPEARRALYERTCDRVFRTLHRMTGNRDDAFDLAQETYVRFFTRLDGFDGRSSVQTWLYRIAVNEALQFIRRRAAESRKLEAAARAWGEKAVSELDPDDARRGEVWAALETLAPTDRAILLLRYQEGLDYRSLGEIFECAEGTVASRLNRARLRLSRIIGGNDAELKEANVQRHPIRER